MSNLTNVEKKKLYEEFNHLGVLIRHYHNKVEECCSRYMIDEAELYLGEARQCLLKREEILQTMYGHGTGIAI